MLGSGALAFGAGSRGGASVAVGPLGGEPRGVPGGHVLGGLPCPAGRLLRHLLEDEAFPFATRAQPTPAASTARFFCYLRCFFFCFFFCLLLLLLAVSSPQEQDSSGHQSGDQHGRTSGLGQSIGWTREATAYIYSSSRTTGCVCVEEEAAAASASSSSSYRRGGARGHAWWRRARRGDWCRHDHTLSVDQIAD